MRSRLQKEVLSLYKQCLTAAKGRPGFTGSVKSEFRQHASVPKSETMRIEYLLRKGQKKLDMMRDPNVSGMGHFVDK